MRTHHRLLIATTLQLMTTFGFAGDLGAVNNDAAFRVYVPNLHPGLAFSASALALQPGAGNLGWAAITTVLPLPTPQWRVQAFNPNYQAGLQLGAHYVRLNSGTDAQLNWSHLRTKNTNAVTVDPASQWVSPFSQTGTTPTYQGQITGVALLKSANATLRFNYDAVNMDVGQYVNFGERLQTRFFTGVSSAWISENLVSTFRGTPQPTLSLNNISTYKGLGPRLGLLNSYDMSHHIHFIGQVAGSVLVGRMQPAEYQFTGTSNDLMLAGIALNREQVSSERVTQFVPAVDAKLGLSYAYPMLQGSELSLEFGYMGTLYINPLSGYQTGTNVIALDTGSLSTSSVQHIQSNFSVNGPYVTGLLRY